MPYAWGNRSSSGDPRPGVAVGATRWDFDLSDGRQSACPVGNTAKRYSFPKSLSPRANGDWATNGGYLLWIAELNVRDPLGIVKEMLVFGSLLDCGRGVVVPSLPFLVQVCCLLQPLRNRCRLAVLARSGNRVDEVRGRDGRDGEVETGLASPVSLPHEYLSPVPPHARLSRSNWESYPEGLLDSVITVVSVALGGVRPRVAHS